jgi:hypothetical protein
MTGPTNPAVELARYRITGGERILKGQRVLGVVRVVDLPAGGMGRHFLVERELITNAELEALVADYLAQAHVLDAVPDKPSCDDAFELPETVAR